MRTLNNWNEVKCLTEEEQNFLANMEREVRDYMTTHCIFLEGSYAEELSKVVECLEKRANFCDYILDSEDDFIDFIGDQIENSEVLEEECTGFHFLYFLIEKRKEILSNFPLFDGNFFKSLGWGSSKKTVIKDEDSEEVMKITKYPFDIPALIREEELYANYNNGALIPTLFIPGVLEVSLRVDEIGEDAFNIDLEEELEIIERYSDRECYYNYSQSIESSSSIFNYLIYCKDISDRVVDFLDNLIYEGLEGFVPDIISNQGNYGSLNGQCYIIDWDFVCGI